MRRFIALLLLCATPSLPMAMAASPYPEFEILPEDYVTGAWMLYRDQFLDPSGRIIDTGNQDISHSEGQGYGMLMAVAADDQDSFDRMLSWTERELHIRDDALAAWKWDPQADPSVSDMNNATDGDLLIAWALLQARMRWGGDAYLARAREIADAILEKTILETKYGPVLLPGADGFRTEEQPDGPIVNLSYWIFPAISDLGILSPDFPSDALIESGLAILRDASVAPSHLPPDWVSLAGERPGPAENFAPTFSYDAVRVPLYLAWHTDEAELIRPFLDAWLLDGSVRVNAVDLATADTVAAMPDPGYLAIADLVACSQHKTAHAKSAKAFHTTAYYPSTLHVLSLIALAQRYPKCMLDRD